MNALVRPKDHSMLRHFPELPLEVAGKILARDVGAFTEVAYVGLETFLNPENPSRICICYRIQNPRRGKGQPETITLMHYVYHHDVGLLQEA